MLSSLTIVVFVVAGCKGGNTAPTDSLTKITIDGQSFQPSASGREGWDHSPGKYVDVILGNCSANAYIYLSLRSPLVVGTVASADIINARYFTEPAGWEWVPGQGRGSLVLTSASPRVSGTFEFDLQPRYFNATGTKFIQGSFDVSFGDGSVC